MHHLILTLKLQSFGASNAVTNQSLNWDIGGGTEGNDLLIFEFPYAMQLMVDYFIWVACHQLVKFI